MDAEEELTLRLSIVEQLPICKDRETSEFSLNPRLIFDLITTLCVRLCLCPVWSGAGVKMDAGCW